MAEIKSGKYHSGAEEIEVVIFEDFASHCAPRAKSRGDSGHKWSLDFRGYPVAPEADNQYSIYVHGVCFRLSIEKKEHGVVVVDAQGRFYVRDIRELQNDPELVAI